MGRNIILVTVDALRADYVYKKNGRTHPFISKLLDESIVVKNAVAPSYATISSFKGLLTDISPNTNLPASRPYFKLPKNAKLLAEELKEKGYITAGFSTNPHITRIQGYDRGFDYFYDGFGDKPDEKTKEYTSWFEDIKLRSLSWMRKNLKIEFHRGKHFWGRLMALFYEPGFESADSIIKKVYNFLNRTNTEKPIFLWVHLMEVHSPYQLEDGLFDEIEEDKIPLWERQWLRHKRHQGKSLSESDLTEKDLEKIKSLYRCGIRKIDKILMNFYKYLKDKELLDDSIFIITSDHGEGLGDRGLISHPSNLFNPCLMVPLIVNDRSNKVVIEKVFGVLNLFHVLSEYADFGDILKPLKKHSGYGIAERRGKQGDFIYSIQDRERKIIYNQSKGRKEYYTIEEDGYEKKVSKTSEFRRLEEALEEHISTLTSLEKDKISNAISKLKI